MLNHVRLLGVLQATGGHAYIFADFGRHSFTRRSYRFKGEFAL